MSEPAAVLSRTPASHAVEAAGWLVVADAEGNEVCICTWQNRYERGV